MNIEPSQIVPFSETVRLMRIGEMISVETTQSVRRWADRLRDDPAVQRVVPTYTDIALHCTPMSAGWSAEAWCTYLNQNAWSDSIYEPRQHLVNVHFDTQSIEFEEYCSRVALGSAEVIERLQRAEFCVGMLGFLPGMPYLIGLPSELHTPRRKELKTVPANAFAIGGGQAGIIPAETISGWWSLGTVRESCFAVSEDPPNRFELGDFVRLVGG